MNLFFKKLKWFDVHVCSQVMEVILKDEIKCNKLWIQCFNLFSKENKSFMCLTLNFFTYICINENVMFHWWKGLKSSLVNNRATRYGFWRSGKAKWHTGKRLHHPSHLLVWALCRNIDKEHVHPQKFLYNTIKYFINF